MCSGEAFVDGVVPPQVAAVGPRDVDAGAAHHQHVLDGALFVVGARTNRFVHRLLQRHRLAAAVLPVGGDDQRGLRVLDPGPQRRRRVAGEHHRVHDTEPRARQHRHDGLGHHRHVDGDPVTGDQAQVGQHVGGLAHLGQQVGISQRAAVADRFALPVDGHPVAVAGLDVTVHAVVGHVELAADEPLGERRLRPVQHLGERCLPGQPVGLFLPERQPVLLGFAVQLGCRVGVVRELRRRWIRGRGFGVRDGHAVSSSVIGRQLPIRARSGAWLVLIGRR